MSDIPPQNHSGDVPTKKQNMDDTERVEATRRIPDRPVVTDAPPPGSASGPVQPRRRPKSTPAQRRRATPARRGYSPQSGPTRPDSDSPPPAARRRAARPQYPSESGLYFPWWSLVLMVGVVGIATFGIVLAVGQVTSPNTLGDQPPRIQVVTSQPTLSQDFAAGQPSSDQQNLWPTPIPQFQPTPTVPLPTPVPSPSLPPGDFVIGARVQVVGVDTNGLNIRSSPGYNGTPRFLAAENDVFVLVDGPQRVDDLEWWRVEDPDDPNRFGWAARNYLAAEGG